MREELLAGLNPEQREAVEHIEGPLLILAGAGSGKTRVLTRRIAWMLTQGVRPWEILAVTFTNKAAGEMKNRVAELVGEDAQHIWVSTFHSTAMRLLRRDIDRLGYTRSFTIYDDDDQTRLLKQISKDLRVHEDKYPPARLRYAIDRAKNRLLSPAQVAELPRNGDILRDLNDPTPQVYAAYQRALEAANAVDFNDLLNLLVRLWTEHADVLARTQDRFRFLMVDEYQDTNAAQYQLVRLLGGRSQNVAVVGDDDQSIYAFRGADIRNILNFQRDFPQAEVIRLEQNYRSKGNILKVASAVVKNNLHRMDKTMRTEADDGAKVRLLVGLSEEDEAAAVLKEIRGLIGGGAAPGDIAVIYRTNAASRAFEQKLIDARLPYALVGTRKFFERREIRDVLSWLKLTLNPADDMSFLRAIGAPARGVGPKALEAIAAEAAELGAPLLAGLEVWSARGGKSRAGGAAFHALILRLQRAALETSPAELVRMVIEESGYAEGLRREDTPEARGRLENLDALIAAVEEATSEPEEEAVAPGEEPLPNDALTRLRGFLDRAALTAGSDELPDENGRVTLLTSHLAKGLEFPYVFVTGLYEGGFPHFRSLERDEDIEEERRLVYVAFTRARERLYLTRPRSRMVFSSGATGRGGRQPAKPSRFLAEIPVELLSGSGGEIAGAMSGVAGAPDIQSRTRPATTFAWAMPTTRTSVPGDHRTLSPDSADAFQPGTEVLHPQFGRGIVKTREGPPANPKLSVHFEKHGRRTLFARLAQLEIILP